MQITIDHLRNMKKAGEKIPTITAYDYTSAKLIDQIGIPLILVGDTLGQVILGYGSTLPVTMQDMVHHTKAVSRGSTNALIVADMPFMSYQITVEDALWNAGILVKEAGAHAVKLEGGISVSETVRRIVSTGIPVMGHIGLTPQSVNQLSGYKVQGKTLDSAKGLVEDAKALEQSGVFSIVLECVPAKLAKLITDTVSVPTISIGSGKDCDGQVQVFHDMLGLFQDFKPKHAKKYSNLAENIENALKSYVSEVKQGIFPDDSHSYQIKKAVLEELRSDLKS
ncbi:MAG: 3-methyl-2-oxobutanoate hydroxymethyltransferase [Dehalococcoidia bacterium]|nr:3-methyl-2-oxobutanoate hydroxymethyltransferase [Dehalococcoidia bacterium]